MDQDAHRPRAPERLKRVSHYRKLDHLFALPLPPKSILNKKSQARTLLLALGLETPFKVENSYDHRVVWYEGQLGSGEFINAQTIQCAVGRIVDSKGTWIVDRGANCGLTFPVFSEQ